MMSLLMILASVASMCASSVVTDNQYIRGFDYAFCAWFTIEFGARLVFCPEKIAFFKEIMTWVDFISLLPFYGRIILARETLNFLRPVRLFRIFRALRFFAFTSGLQIIVQSLKASFRELILLLIILLIPVVVFSSVLFEIENKKPDQPHFNNIPEAFWWAIITMTTVGYGDMVPKTILGRIVGGFCAICGVLIVALPVSVIGNNFSTYYSHAQARLSLPKKKRRLIVGEAKLRIGAHALQSQTTSSTDQSIRHHSNHGGLQSCAENASEQNFIKKYRRYHRRSRNTLFAHGDVYIGPGPLVDGSKAQRGNSLEEAENESEREVKSDCPTLSETVSSQGVNNLETTNNLTTPDFQEGRPSTPRLTLMNSTQESEEIIEEDTRTDPARSNHCNGFINKTRKSFSSPTSRKKSINSRSWVELKSSHSAEENRRVCNPIGFKSRVSPATDHTICEINSSMNTRTLSPALTDTGSFLNLNMDTTYLDTPSFGISGHHRRTPSSNVANVAFQRTRKTSEHELSNGHTV